jgi:hypothetical protein
MDKSKLTNPLLKAVADELDKQQLAYLLLERDDGVQSIEVPKLDYSFGIIAGSLAGCPISNDDDIDVFQSHAYGPAGLAEMAVRKVRKRI